MGWPELAPLGLPRWLRPRRPWRASEKAGHEGSSRRRSVKIEIIGVVGSGTMGSGIAHTAALYGRRVVLVDVEKTLLDRAMGTIDRNLQRGVEKGRMSVEEKGAVLGRIEPTIDMRRLDRADFVIEAVFEDEKVKKDIFARLDGIARAGVVLASNTSSISIT